MQNMEIIISCVNRQQRFSSVSLALGTAPDIAEHYSHENLQISAEQH